MCLSLHWIFGLFTAVTMSLISCSQMWTSFALFLMNVNMQHTRIGVIYYTHDRADYLVPIELVTPELVRTIVDGLADKSIVPGLEPCVQCGLDLAFEVTHPSILNHYVKKSNDHFFKALHQTSGTSLRFFPHIFTSSMES